MIVRERRIKKTQIEKKFKNYNYSFFLFCYRRSMQICEKQLYKWQLVRDKQLEEKGRYQQIILRNRTLERRMI